MDLARLPGALVVCDELTPTYVSTFVTSWPSYTGASSEIDGLPQAHNQGISLSNGTAIRFNVTLVHPICAAVKWEVGTTFAMGESLFTTYLTHQELGQEGSTDSVSLSPGNIILHDDSRTCVVERGRTFELTVPTLVGLSDMTTWTFGSLPGSVMSGVISRIALFNTLAWYPHDTYLEQVREWLEIPTRLIGV